MNIKFKISIPFKDKMLNWRCNLHFHFNVKTMKKKKKAVKQKTEQYNTMKKIEILEDNLHSSSQYLDTIK